MERSELDMEMKQRLEQYMEDWAGAGRFSGTVLIARGEDILLRKGYGFANHEHQVPNTASTIYSIGSITKQFTAVAVLQLIEEGILRPDKPVAVFLPEYKHAREVTIHHLLSSSSGIPDYTELPEYNTRLRLSPGAIVEWLNHRPLQYTPGQSVQKSNTNFVLLARIVELASGMSIEDYYKARVFKQAGLLHTGVCRNEDVIPGRAYGYSCSGEGLVQAEYYEMTGAYGSGFLYSNADDLLSWTRSLEQEVLISRASYEKMITPYGFLRYMGVSVGYGCSLKGSPVEEVIADGNIFGYTCSVLRHLKEDYTVILLSNNDSVCTGRVMKGLKSILSGQEPHVLIKPVTVDLEDYTPYQYLAGKYRFPLTGWSFTVSFRNGRLTANQLFIQQAKREEFPLELVSSGENCIVLACKVCDSTYTFHTDDAGSVKKAVYTWDTLELPYERVE
jgi:CubicO group peptidase (beta-lactamase class C family)